MAKPAHKISNERSAFQIHQFLFMKMFASVNKFQRLRSAVFLGMCKSRHKCWGRSCKRVKNRITAHRFEMHGQTFCRCFLFVTIASSLAFPVRNRMFWPRFNFGRTIPLILTNFVIQILAAAYSPSKEHII